jgi:hypothetical protein
MIRWSGSSAEPAGFARQHVRSTKRPFRPDNDMRERLFAEPAKATWAPGRSHHFAVRDGAVDLNGVTCDEKKCWVLRVAAKNPSGVRAVGSYIVRAEPVSGTISAKGAHGDQTVSSECDESRAGLDRGVPQMRSPSIALGCEFYL